uniref:Uncharacterized protein n=1 Tax=Anguilla anguilla TaxID=7936 RepID=A0A0E9X0C4_ANGAN
MEHPSDFITGTVFFPLRSHDDTVKSGRTPFCGVKKLKHHAPLRANPAHNMKTHNTNFQRSEGFGKETTLFFYSMESYIGQM